MKSPPCTFCVTYSICYTSHVTLSCLWYYLWYYYRCRLIGQICFMTIFGDFDRLLCACIINFDLLFSLTQFKLKLLFSDV